MRNCISGGQSQRNNERKAHPPMRTRNTSSLNALLFALIAGQAAYYFISGRYLNESAFWNTLVGIQFVCGLIAFLVNVRSSCSRHQHPEGKSSHAEA